MIKILYRFYQFFIALPLLLLATFLAVVITSIGCICFNAHIWSYYPGKIWGRLMCFFLLLPVKVTGRENIDANTSYVFVANHQGAMDIFLIYGYLGHNFKWMMKKALRKMFLIGYACEKGNHIFVDKAGAKKIQGTYEKARKTLQNGTSLAVFPEGTRTFDGQLKPFKKGAFLLAQELNLPIVPITINGSFQTLPRTKGFNFVNWNTLELIIHPPIYPYSEEEGVQHIIQQAYQSINNALKTTV